MFLSPTVPERHKQETNISPSSSGEFQEHMGGQYLPNLDGPLPEQHGSYILRRSLCPRSKISLFHHYSYRQITVHANLKVHVRAKISPETDLAFFIVGHLFSIKNRAQSSSCICVCSPFSQGSATSKLDENLISEAIMKQQPTPFKPPCLWPFSCCLTFHQEPEITHQDCHKR